MTIKYLNKPIKHTDVLKYKDLPNFLESFACTSFQARNLSRCVKVYHQMLQDEHAVIFLGLAGALVPAGMRKIIADLIRYHLVDVLVSTGANLYHDFYEAIGYHHYIGNLSISDTDLRQASVDRIYDIFASDTDFGRAEEAIAEIVSKMEQKVYSSREFLAFLATKIDDNDSILCAARDEGIPIFCPALCDSAIGIALTHHYVRSNNFPCLIIDHIRDNFEILQIKRAALTTGVIYLGGGVPKNYIQQLSPMLDAFYEEDEGHKYFIQLTTDDPKYGGLSGCTASEAESWGKVAIQRLAATSYLDATIGLPLLAGAILNSRVDKPLRSKRVFHWKNDQLEEMKIE